MAIRALHDIRLSHEGLEGGKDHPQRLMHELASEQAKQWAGRILSCTWNAVRVRPNTQQQEEYFLGLLGIRLAQGRRDGHDGQDF